LACSEADGPEHTGETVGRLMVERALDSEREAGWRAERTVRAATGRNRPHASDRRVRPGFDAPALRSKARPGFAPGGHQPLSGSPYRIRGNTARGDQLEK